MYVYMYVNTIHHISHFRSLSLSLLILSLSGVEVISLSHVKLLLDLWVRLMRRVLRLRSQVSE